MDRKLLVYDIRMGFQQFRTLCTEPLLYPVNAVKLFPDNTGVVAAGTEGRCRVLQFSSTAGGSKTSDFTFRTHRVNDAGEAVIGIAANAHNLKIYPVHAVDFNPIYRTFLTAGGDGFFYSWDKDNRNRLYLSANFGAPLVCSSFDPSGRLAAIGSGYDWAFGIVGRQTTNQQPKIAILPMKDAWIKCKKKK